MAHPFRKTSLSFFWHGSPDAREITREGHVFFLVFCGNPAIRSYSGERAAEAAYQFCPQQVEMDVGGSKTYRCNAAHPPNSPHQPPHGDL